MKRSFLIISILIGSKLVAQVDPQGPPPPPVEMRVVHERSSIIEFPDVEASFKGGSKAFQNYMGKNIRYPQLCIDQRIQTRATGAGPPHGIGHGSTNRTRAVT